MILAESQHGAYLVRAILTDNMLEVRADLDGYTIGYAAIEDLDYPREISTIDQLEDITAELAAEAIEDARATLRRVCGRANQLVYNQSR